MTTYYYVFGRETASNTYTTQSGNTKYVSKFTLASASDIDGMSFHVWSGQTRGIRGVIYADSGGSPGELLATTDAFSGNTAPGWNYLDFPALFNLPAGDYWLGLITNGSLYVNLVSATGTNVSNSDTYSDGPTDPFGTPTTQTKETPVYAAITGPDTPDKTSISKAVGYAVLSVADQTNISKVVGYAVLSTEVTVGISKVVGYAVLEDATTPPVSTRRPMVFVCT